eukprot:sb/3470087/
MRLETSFDLTYTQDVPPSVFFHKTATIHFPRFKYIYSFKWGSLNYFLLEERIREKAVLMRKIPNIGSWVVYTFTSLVTVILMLLGVVYCLSMIYIQRTFASLIVGEKMFQEKDVGDFVASVLVSLVNAILVTSCVNPLFEYFSLKLTNFERHYFESAAAGDQEPTETSKQPIRTRYLGHVTDYQPIRDQLSESSPLSESPCSESLTSCLSVSL